METNRHINIQPIRRYGVDKRTFAEPYADDTTRDFIIANELLWNPITRRYDCNGSVRVLSDLLLHGKLKIRFGVIKNCFDCSGIGMFSLEGCPTEVSGYFDCGNNYLTSLFGAPMKVEGFFGCEHNELHSLEYSPKYVGGDFYCHNNLLENLVGSPEYVDGDYICNNNKLKSIEGLPKTVNGNFLFDKSQSHLIPVDKPSWLKGNFKENDIY